MAGRGELQLAILLESMRREGYEVCVTQPTVLLKKDQSGAVIEPMEELLIETPDVHSGVIIEYMNKRLAKLNEVVHCDDHRVILKLDCPSRGLIGLRSHLTALTHGTATLSSIYSTHVPFLGHMTHIEHGSLISLYDGKATAYALNGLESRGVFFIKPQVIQ